MGSSDLHISKREPTPTTHVSTRTNSWSTTSKSELRTSCFLSIRQLALKTPFPFVEQVMKGVYLSFVRNAKSMGEQSRAAVAMMGKCIVEILGVDMVAAYQHAFVYIRQLAIHLRNAIKNKSKDAYAAGEAKRGRRSEGGEGGAQ